MGIHIDIQTTSNHQRAHMGLSILKQLMKSLNDHSLFSSEDYRIWKGYPLESLGEIKKNFNSLDLIVGEDLIGRERKKTAWGSDTRIINHSLEIIGSFHFIVEGKLQEIPGYILFSGDEAKVELPTIHIETYTMHEKDMHHLLKGERNDNREKLINCLYDFYHNLDDYEQKNTTVFIGENYQCVKFFHYANFILTDSDISFFKKFLKYAIELRKIRKSEKELLWLKVARKDILQLFNRTDYFKDKFLHNLINALPIKYSTEEKPAKGFMLDYVSEYMVVETTSFAVIDPDFTGRNMKAMLNDLLVKFTSILQGSLEPKEVIQQRFVNIFQQSLEEWHMTRRD